MFKGQYNLFSSLLRIITLEEISDFVRFSEGGTRQSLTELMLDDGEVSTEEKSASQDKEAKVLKFKQDGAGYEVTEDDVFSRKEVRKRQSSTQLKHLSNTAPEDEVEVIEKVNIASFILYEKQKLEKINQIVKKRELIKLYQDTSAVDIEQEKQFRDDLSKSSKLGILLNKRQS